MFILHNRLVEAGFLRLLHNILENKKKLSIIYIMTDAENEIYMKSVAGLFLY